MGAVSTILWAILILFIVAIIIAILRPIYTMKVVEPNIYENRLSFWKYVGTVILATIVIYVAWLILWIVQSKMGPALVL